jgi:hypothetical protein
MIASQRRTTVWRISWRGRGAPRSWRSCTFAVAVVTVLTGCSQQSAEPAYAADLEDRLTIAVAPALNFSASSDVDPVRLGDLMASELSQAGGVGVIGVNRVLAVLAREGRDGIRSPGHAVALCEELGADAVLVFAVTEYDPYAPPVMAITAQLYGPRPIPETFDPVSTSRAARPSGAAEAGFDPLEPWAEVQRTYNAADETIAADVERFARPRDAGRSPLGWRRYLASQELFARYCCHRTVVALLRREADRVMAESVALKE